MERVPHEAASHGYRALPNGYLLRGDTWRTPSPCIRTPASTSRCCATCTGAARSRRRCRRAAARAPERRRALRRVVAAPRARGGVRRPGRVAAGRAGTGRRVRRRCPRPPAAVRPTTSTGHRPVMLADVHYPFEVALTYRVLADVDVIVRTTRLRNTGAEPVFVDAPRPPVGRRRRATAIHDHPVRRGAHRDAGDHPAARRRPGGHRDQVRHHRPRAPAVGRAGHGTRCWSAALDWSGPHRTVVQTMEDGGTHIVQGVNDLGQHHRLEPGAELALPDSVGVYAPDGSTARRCAGSGTSGGTSSAAPGRGPCSTTRGRPPTTTSAPVISSSSRRPAVTWASNCSWWTTAGSATQASGTAKLGDWHPTPGFGALRRRARDGPAVRGLGRAGKRQRRQRPVPRPPRLGLPWPTREPTLVPRLRHELVLDYTREDVRDHIVDTLDRLITDASVDFLKWDMNRPLTELYTPDRMTALAHTEGCTTCSTA